MKTIGIIYNHHIAQARPLAEEIAAWIKQQGRKACIGATDEASTTFSWQEIGLAVTLGGDGSILRATQAAAPHNVPILGINLGQVGFLTEVEPKSWQETLSRALVDDCWIEKRMMLRAITQQDGETLGQAEALNDIVVGRGAQARVVHMCAEVDGDHLATYVADGLIVATPTGSTAYALAAGGPVMPPQLRNILITPVAPHLSMARPIVLSEGVIVRITLISGRPAILTVDGKVQAKLKSGDKVIVKASPHIARFARVREQTYFYKTLVARLRPRDFSR